MRRRKPRVLVACEFSGAVRDAFARLGADAWSCDLYPSETPGQHIHGDVTAHLCDAWDLIVAHPPCTFLANSGVRWLKTDPKRMREVKRAAAFFRQCLNAPCPRVAVENPIMHKYGRDLAAGLPDQVVQPWMFGHGETKATCLWLRGLPPLVPTRVVAGRVARVHRLPPSADRWKERSRTYRGIAEAMAAQWMPLLTPVAASRHKRTQEEYTNADAA